MAETKLAAIRQGLDSSQRGYAKRRTCGNKKGVVPRIKTLEC